MAELKIPSSRIQIASSNDWRSAVTSSLSLLLNEGFVTPNYISTVLTSIDDGKGLYMALGDRVMLAHSRPEAGALATGLSLVVLKNAVNLGDNEKHPIQIIFGLSATDNHSHQTLMAELAKVLMKPEVRESLIEASDKDEIERILETA